MIEGLANLLRACRAADVPATAEDVVDAAWLACWFAPAPAPSAPTTESQPDESTSQPGSDQSAEEDAYEPIVPLDSDVRPEEELPEPTEGLPEAAAESQPGGEPVGVFLPAAGGGGAPGRAFYAPGAPALPRSLELARALRPLARRVPGRTRFVLDEARTIERFAQEGLCDPVLRPAPERWLNLSLVIDTGAGSDLWKDVARELRALLGALGAFRDVRTWSLDFGVRPPRLAPGAWSGAAGVTRDPRGLIDPTGRTLTLVLSPCIASGWHDGGAAGALGALAARGPVVLVPLLPEYLWPRTALASAVPVTVTASAAGVPNGRLALSRPDAWPGEETLAGVALPVAVLEPASLRRWVALVAGRSGAAAPGFILESHPAAEAAEPASPAPAVATPAERVAQFRRTASPLARRLAGLLAAAPVISLPIVRLVRESLLRQAGQPHEAEVLFGGLLTRTAEAEADPRFEFFPGTRDLLLDATPTDLSVKVLEAVSGYLGEHLSSGRTFRAVLADPASAAGELEADASPFARIAADVLLRAGGDYARIVRSLPRKRRPTGKPVESGVFTAPDVTIAAAGPPAPEPAPEPPPPKAFPPDVMVELEALTIIPPDPRESARRAASQYERRFRIPPNKPQRLGRDADRMDCPVPEDDLLSRFQAVLTWEPTKGTLAVQTRPATPPNYPTPPPNRTFVLDEKQKKLVEAGGGYCAIEPEKSFWIGQTRFTVRATDKRYQEPPAPVATPPAPEPVREERSPTFVLPSDAVAELEAVTEVQVDPRKSDKLVPRQYGRRFLLPPNKPQRLGRDEAKMDIAIPEDDQLSRFQAILTWEPTRGTLTVQTRPAMPPHYTTPPANQTLVFDEKLKKLVEADGGRCVVGKGESFWIGQTRFVLHTTDERYQESPEDLSLAARQEERTRAQLEEIPFANPGAALRAMEQLPAVIRAVTSEQGLFRQMLKVVMNAMPRADAAAIVRIPPDCPPGEHRVAVTETNVRPKTVHADGGFQPSRHLVHRAVAEKRRSCLHCWSPQVTEHPGTDMTMTVAEVHGVTPWAVCTPFQDGSRFALYVAGQIPGQWNLLSKAQQDKIVSDLTQYQKIAELLVGMVETTLRVSRLTQQNKMIRRAWPASLWKYLDDADELERMLAPKEMEITALFCDLRDYSLFASQNVSQLLEAQRQVSAALNVMSGAITDREGVVSGFRGDAVLGFWGWPKPHERQIELAARAALSIQGRSGGTGGCGVALTHGVAVAGRLGAHDAAVVDLYGPAVNLTFRLEAMTKAFGVSIIVSQEVADRIAAADPYGREMRTRPLGKVRAKGFPEPYSVHELYSAHVPSIQDFQHDDWAMLVDQFTAGNWDDAYDGLATQFLVDPAARCLMRVMDRTRRTPPPGWDGSFVPPGADES